LWGLSLPAGYVSVDANSKSFLFAKVVEPGRKLDLAAYDGVAMSAVPNMAA
jgi:hypothetical protein